jgi:formylglycine-generating enzyme required for sulfatase activity
MVMLPVRDRAYPEWAVFIGKYPVTNAQFRRYVALGERIEPRWGMARAVWWNTEPGRRLRAQDMHRIRTWRHQEGRPVGELFTHNVNKADGHWEGPFEPWNDPHFSADDQPVVCIDFFLAYRYARWVSQMAHDERIVTTLPSVRAWDIGCFGNIFPSRDPRNWLETSAGIHHRKEAPATIDRSGGRTNRWGISDLIGNVWEWCSDEIAAQSMSHLAILSAPYPASPAALRGGGYLDDMEKVSPFLDVASLTDQEYTSHTDLGFRIAAAVHVSRVPTDVGQRLATVDMADELIFFHPTK